MYKKRRKKKQITFHIKSRFVDNFISENKVHVCKHFIYLFIYYFVIYHSFKLVKGGFICKLFEDRWGIFFSLRQDILIFDDVHSSACNIGNFLGQAFVGTVYFFVFWSASKKNYKFEINVKNVFLKCFHIFFWCANYFFMVV